MRSSCPRATSSSASGHTGPTPHNADGEYHIRIGRGVASVSFETPAELEEYCRDKHDASAGCDLDMIYQMMVQHGAAEDAVSMPSHALHAQAATELASWGPGIEEAVQQLYAGLW